ncbi:MAG: D-alanine--D-alanine ligase [Clostridia bacterium]|nr:D-alanine--D-alanine ligase [Clostridia bacterium]
MNIVVLCGGLSPEREVSISSSTMVCNALLDRGHRAVMVDSFLGLPEFDGDFDALFAGAKKLPPYTVSPEEPNLAKIKALRTAEGDTDTIGRNVVALCKYADIVYIGLHGNGGENGDIQGYFDNRGIRYTGTNAEGCRMAMDKWVSKRIFNEFGVTTPRGALLKKGEPIRYDSLPLPAVVKPCSGGSSIATTIVRDRSLLQPAIELAFKQEDRVLVENLIEGREFAVGVLGEEALPVIEILPKAGFYDYRNKYIAGLTREVCPANIEPKYRELLQTMAIKGFAALKLQVYARFDFILTPEGRAFCLEGNTLPGMTPTSLLPQEAAAAGIDYPSLCERIIKLSLEK